MRLKYHPQANIPFSNFWIEINNYSIWIIIKYERLHNSIQIHMLFIIFLNLLTDSKIHIDYIYYCFLVNSYLLVLLHNTYFKLIFLISRLLYNLSFYYLRSSYDSNLNQNPWHFFIIQLFRIQLILYLLISIHIYYRQIFVFKIWIIKYINNNYPKSTFYSINYWKNINKKNDTIFTC